MITWHGLREVGLRLCNGAASNTLSFKSSFRMYVAPYALSCHTATLTLPSYRNSGGPSLATLSLKASSSRILIVWLRVSMVSLSVISIL